jgi:hypothetical protein
VDGSWLVRSTVSVIVIAGLDPAIPANSGGCGGARIKSGHDEKKKTFLRPR